MARCLGTVVLSVFVVSVIMCEGTKVREGFISSGLKSASSVIEVVGLLAESIGQLIRIRIVRVIVDLRRSWMKLTGVPWLSRGLWTSLRIVSTMRLRRSSLHEFKTFCVFHG